VTDPPAPSTTGGPGGRGADDPAQRGGLVIANRVVERIATLAAGEVEGVAKAGSGLDQVLGHRYPKANATVAGDRARIHVEIAITWPHPLGQVCGRVRDEVRNRVTEVIGVRVDAVDVTAANVVHASQPEQRRVQ
jgi:uncharacterized alkaline shock family protein YloU